MADQLQLIANLGNGIRIESLWLWPIETMLNTISNFVPSCFLKFCCLKTTTLRLVGCPGRVSDLLWSQCQINIH